MSPDSHNMKIVPERDDDEVPVKSIPVRAASKRGKGAGGSNSNASGSSSLLWVAIVLLLAGLFAVYYQNTQLANTLTEQQLSLKQAGARIQLLENELTATGLDLSQSGSTLEKRIESSELEIRKLWDLSNKRNKPNIAQNDAALKVLTKKLAAIESDLKAQQVTLNDAVATQDNKGKALQTEQKALSQRFSALQTGLSDQQTALNTFKTEFNRLQTELKALPIELKALPTELKALQTKLNANRLSMDANISELERNQEQLKTQIDSISQQFAQKGGAEVQHIKQTLQDYNERLDAIDASRRQLTSHVTRLNTEVNSLQLEMNALTKK